MDKDFIDRLLYRAEGEALDFKRDQYVFVNADDFVKSELLKDVLAFANSWRKEEAFILIGVDEARGKPSQVVGVSHHLQDSDLQQFVNSKTNRPVRFSYIVVDCQGREVGVIHIPVQTRPIYAIRDYGIVKRNVVYVRRGSSCAEADPNEIAKMGAEDSKDAQTPNLEIQLANIQERLRLGTTLEIECCVLQGSPRLTTFLEREDSEKFLGVAFGVETPRYRKNLTRYLQLTSLLRPIGFVATNRSGVVARNVRIEIMGMVREHLLMFDEDSRPVRPQRGPLPAISGFTSENSSVHVTQHGNQWTLLAELGDVQPRATVWSQDCWYVGVAEPSELALDAKVYADNLPIPHSVPINLNFTTRREELTVEVLAKELEADSDSRWEDQE